MIIRLCLIDNVHDLIRQTLPAFVRAINRFKEAPVPNLSSDQFDKEMAETAKLMLESLVNDPFDIFVNGMTALAAVIRAPDDKPLAVYAHTNYAFVPTWKWSSELKDFYVGIGSLTRVVWVTESSDTLPDYTRHYSARFGYGTYKVDHPDPEETMKIAALVDFRRPKIVDAIAFVDELRARYNPDVCVWIYLPTSKWVPITLSKLGDWLDRNKRVECGAGIDDRYVLSDNANRNRMAERGLVGV